MKDIEKELYKFSKEIEYDDDFAVLFYKGEKIAKGKVEDFKDCWCEAASDFDTVEELLRDIRIDIELDPQDAVEPWENIWNELDWNESSKSYKYENWELIILDI